jgi:hypothetical protein
MHSVKDTHGDHRIPEAQVFIALMYFHVGYVDTKIIKLIYALPGQL